MISFYFLGNYSTLFLILSSLQRVAGFQKLCKAAEAAADGGRREVVGGGRQPPGINIQLRLPAPQATLGERAVPLPLLQTGCSLSSWLERFTPDSSIHHPCLHVNSDFRQAAFQFEMSAVREALQLSVERESEKKRKRRKNRLRLEKALIRNQVLLLVGVYLTQEKKKKKNCSAHSQLTECTMWAESVAF